MGETNLLISIGNILKESIEQHLFETSISHPIGLQDDKKTLPCQAKDRALLKSLETLLSDLIIPLRQDKIVTGFLSIRDERQKEAFSNDEIDALSLLGEQLAIIVQNGRIFSRLKEKDRLATLGQMSAGLAHEIRNPLTAIKGAAQALEHMQKRNKNSHLLSIITEEADRLNGVVSEFLNYAKPNKQSFTDINLNQVIKNTLEIINHDHSYGIKPILQLESGIPAINGDPMQLRQILINLLLNTKTPSMADSYPPSTPTK